MNHRTLHRAKALLFAGVALSVIAASMPARANVGVAAAVNVDAKGTPPGGAPRVLALGNSIVFNEKVTTDDNGLVQILLLDGTTFTVGPNSDLTIDKFVYNPDTGEAKVVASLTKGAFRFVGARTSQTEGGAIVNTPVGTIGIRGAVTNISYDPSSGQTTAALVAGKSLTITDTDGTQRVVYENGFTAVISKDPGGATTTTVRKSTAAETRVFQTQVTSKSGQSGGAANKPTDTTVTQSGVATVNSGLPGVGPIPPTKPVQSSTVETVEEDVADIDLVTQQTTRQDVVQNSGGPGTQGPGAQPGPGPGEPPPPEPFLLARVLTAPDVYVTDYDESYNNPGGRGFVGSSPESDRVAAFYKRNGRLVAPDLGIDLPDFSGTQGDVHLTPYNATGTVDGQSVSGTAWAGAGDFVAYLTGVNNDPTQPAYILYGTPTDTNALNSFRSGFNLREYVLTPDRVQQTPVPFFSDDRYGPIQNFNTTPLYVVEAATSSSPEPKLFQSWIDIQGSGVNQKSALGLTVGEFFFNDDGILVADNGRRGSFRDSATAGATLMRGGIGTLEGASGGHFFGPHAENFVLGTVLDPVDTFFDDRSDRNYDYENDTYASDGQFGTQHVAGLISETPLSAITTRNPNQREFSGFMSGMADSRTRGTNDHEVYALGAQGGDGGADTNFNLLLDPANNEIRASASVSDIENQSSVVSSLLLHWGIVGDDFGQSVLVDDNRYAAYQNNNPENTVLVTDDNVAINHADDFSAGQFLVSGRATPVGGYEHCTNCDFIQWGWWGTRNEVDLPPGEGEEQPPTRRGDYVHMGTWVAGDVTTPEQLAGDLPFGGFANYQGTVIGNVARNMGEGGVAQYIATGDVAMSYDFTYGSGSINITNFDGANETTAVSLSGSMSDHSSDTQALFAGSISGANPYDEGTLNGSVNGAFVNNGPTVAAGIIGGFSFTGSGVTAVGTIAGAAQVP